MFSSFKVKDILETMQYFFLFILVFSNICRQLVTLQALCTVRQVNLLMPGGNKQTCKYYLKDFIEPSMNVLSHETLKGEVSQDIYPWLFQRRHFGKSLAIFSALSVKYQPSKISLKCFATKFSTFQHKCNNVASMILQIKCSKWNQNSYFCVIALQHIKKIDTTTAYERITKRVNASNFT